MQSGESLEERVGIASRVLTEMTRNVGIAAALPSRRRNWNISNWSRFPNAAS